MYASIELDGFYCTALNLDGCAVVHDQDRVLCSTKDARRKKVFAGMPLSEAKTILRETATYHPYRAEEFAQAAEQWHQACLVAVNGFQVVAPHHVLLDLGVHPNPTDVLLTVLQEICQVTPGGFKVGMARCSWVAQCVATQIDRQVVQLGIYPVEPLTDLAGFYKRFPTKRLTLLPEPEREKLSLLGYRRCGDVAALGVATLNVLFGRRAGLIHQIVTGRLPQSIRPNYPPNSISQRIAFGYPVDDRQVIQEAINQMANKLALELQHRDAHCSQLTLIAELEGELVQSATKSLNKPAARAVLLRVALEKLFETLGLVNPVALRVILPRLVSANRVQSTIAGLLEGAERNKSAHSAVNKVNDVFGGATVQLASSMVPSRRELWLRYWSHVTGWS